MRTMIWSTKASSEVFPHERMIAQRFLGVRIPSLERKSESRILGDTSLKDPFHFFTPAFTPNENSIPLKILSFHDYD